MVFSEQTDSDFPRGDQAPERGHRPKLESHRPKFDQIRERRCQTDERYERVRLDFYNKNKC